MRALVKTIAGPGGVELKDVPEPGPGDDDVKIKIYACGICGSDIHILHGMYPTNPPLILGHECSGTIAEMGKNVKGFDVGDRVVVQTSVETCGECEWCRQGLRMLCPERKSIGSGRDGAFTEYMVVPARHVFHLPENVSLTTAALCEPLACVVRTVCERTQLHAGDYALVSGAGVMGQLAAQVAHANGATVIMTGLEADEAERFPMARKLGAVAATVRVDQEGALEKIAALTGGMGPHVVYECAGAAAAANFCLQALRKTGTYAQIAIPGKPIPMDMDLALYKEIILTNSYASERTSWLQSLSLLKHDLVNIAPLASAVLPLEQWEEGCRRTMDKEGFKILLMPHPEEQE